MTFELLLVLTLFFFVLFYFQDIFFYMHKNPYETLKQKKYAKKHNRSLLRVRIKQDICDIVVETTLKLNKRESTFFCQVHCVWETI